MKDLQTLFNDVKKYTTLTNILIIVIVCILVYFVYQLVGKYYKDPILEGFVAKKELSDLLDKLRIKLYEKESIWNNELFNEQPDRKERPASFWEAKNDTGEPFKKVGQSLSLHKDYDMPDKNTMLINGDAKPPIDSKLLFQFPDNIITRNEKDSKEYNVYTGIRNLTDIDERLKILNEIYSVIIKYKEEQIKLIELVIEKVKDKFGIKIYGKNSFFTNSPMYTIKSGTPINIPENKYSSISFPLGSKLSLQSEHSNETLEIDLPMRMILDNSGNPKSLDEDLYNYIISKLHLDGNDFNPYGIYGLRAVDALDSSVINNIDNSSESTDFTQDMDTVYSPNGHSESVGGLFTAIATLGISEATSVSIAYSYNYAISKKGKHTLYGRKDLFNFAKNNLIKKTESTSDIKIFNPVDVYYDTNNYIGFKNELYDLKEKTDSIGKINKNEDTTLMGSPYVTEDPSKEELNTDNIKEIEKEIEKHNKSYYWFNIDIPDEEYETTIATNMIFVNLAFMFTTMKKSLKRVGEFAKDVNSYGGDCCEIAEKTEESLSRRSNFQGYLTSGSASINMSEEENPFINKINKQKAIMLGIIDKCVGGVATMINKLDNLKRDILENRFEHFPFKIYRPIPPKNYVSLGDVIYNHRHVNYNLRQPLLDNIACIPIQCFKEVRDWLSIDKVYEYRKGDVYLGIFKNPYLQTFNIVTVPDTMPPNRVGKVVACVENCKLLDDIIEADKCAKKFFKANKAVIEGTNLDPDNAIISRESTLYKNKIQNKQDRINTLKEVSRRLQIQDDKANIINKQYNKQKLQDLVDTQRRNINTIVDELDDGKDRIDVNVKFSFEKFQGLITILQENNVLPLKVAQEISNIVDKVAKKKLDVLPDEEVKNIINKCPTPNTEGLVVKALVESGCYNCYNLK